MSEQTFEEKYPAIAAEMAATKEAVRVERWWATYNAALTGICTRMNLEAFPLPDHSDYDVDHVDLHQFAWNCATQAHGEKP